MKKFGFLLCGLFVLAFFGNWGFLIHRTVNQLAIYQLPKSMQYFFYEQKEYIVKESVRPDERRNSDSTEATRHFIDFEWYGDSAAWKMPMEWKEAVKKFPKDSLLEYGHLPYVIMDVHSKLTNAFKQRNKDSILFYAADLGHYLGDAHVPLHTSLNYDGQLTGQKGLHSLWESMIPEIELNSYDLSGKQKSKYLDNPQKTVWGILRRSFTLTKDVFQLEEEVSKNFTEATKYRVQNRRGREVKSYTTEFARAYGQRLAPTVNDQLLRSANAIADFWYTAWVNAGRPDLTKLSKAVSKAERKTVKKEVADYRENKLLKKGLLISRRPQKAEASE